MLCCWRCSGSRSWGRGQCVLLLSPSAGWRRGQGILLAPGVRRGRPAARGAAPAFGGAARGIRTVASMSLQQHQQCKVVASEGILKGLADLELPE